MEYVSGQEKQLKEIKLLYFDSHREYYYFLTRSFLILHEPFKFSMFQDLSMPEQARHFFDYQTVLFFITFFRSGFFENRYRNYLFSHSSKHVSRAEFYEQNEESINDNFRDVMRRLLIAKGNESEKDVALFNIYKQNKLT